MRKSTVKYFVLLFIILYMIIYTGCLGTGNKPVPVLESTISAQSGILTFKGNDYTAYQGEDVRVYFSYWQQIGYMDYDDMTREQMINDYQKSLNELGVLFRTGVVSGEMFYENYNGYRRLANNPVEPIEGKPAFQTGYGQDVANYKGRVLKIFDHELEFDPAFPFTRYYHIWVQMEKSGDDWGEFDHYTLIIDLPNYDSKEYNLRYQDAKMVELKYVRE